MKSIIILSLLMLGLLALFKNVEGKCHDFPRVKSATLNRGSRTSFKEGEYLKHTCLPGFDSVNDIKTYCRGGKWSQPRFGCNRCYGHWTLIFRAMGGIGKETTETYMNSDLASEKDKSIPNACSTRNTRGHCRNHYRSSLIDDWDLLKIKKVKIEFLSHGKHAAHVVFNGVGTTSTNWFDKRRILSSSYNDIKSLTSNVFSMFGHVWSSGQHRRWVINHRYNGCPNDQGWIVTLEKSGPCTFEKHRKYPAFFYSPYSWVAKLNDYREADLMAIYIEADGLCT